MSARAQGKVILFGEHAVVYGVPAIAVGIDRGAWAKCEASTSSEGESNRLHVRGWDLRVTDDVDAMKTGDGAISRAFRDLLVETNARRAQLGEPALGGLSVEADADLPPGGGLGCSAALGVAIARAIDPGATHDEIATRSMAWERVFHGNPSGVDAAVSARGGCVYFKKGEPITSVALPCALQLCIGHTGSASSTKTMVDGVARLHARRPEVTQKAFDGIRSIVDNARLALIAGDLRAVGRFMDLNQMLLAGLFVSSEEIERLASIAREAGALGAKLTGAGGGGCVVALAEDRASAERVVDSWGKSGFSGFVTKVGVDAVAEEPRARIVEVAP